MKTIFFCFLFFIFTSSTHAQVSKKNLKYVLDISSEMLQYYLVFKNKDSNDICCVRSSYLINYYLRKGIKRKKAKKIILKNILNNKTFQLSDDSLNWHCNFLELDSTFYSKCVEISLNNLDFFMAQKFTETFILKPGFTSFIAEITYFLWLHNCMMFEGAEDGADRARIGVFRNKRIFKHNFDYSVFLSLPYSPAK
jgi:hypothetical protein